MGKTRESIPTGAWPRMMRQDLAAAYLDISPSKLRADVAAGAVPAPALSNPPRWDREKLDDWINDRSNTEPSTAIDWLKKLDNAHQAEAR